MSPPLYLDLGKSARDLFSRGYNFGFVKSDTTTKSGDIEFKTNVAQNIATGKLAGAVDVKYKISQHGTTLTERWNTDNVLSSEVVIDDKFLKGLKIVLDSSYAPIIGKRSGKLRSEFRHDKASLSSEIKLDGTGGTILNGAIVVGHENFYAGYQTGFDINKNSLTHNHISLAADVGDFNFHTYVQNGTEYGGSVCHKVKKDLELAANMSWVAGEQMTRFGVAAKYDLDKDTVLRAKINNTSQLAVALTTSLNPGLKLTVSAAINVQNINDGSHKLGFGIEYSP